MRAHDRGILPVRMRREDVEARRGLLDLATSTPPLKVFYYGGDRHGALVFPFAESPGLVAFLNAQLSGDPTWTSVIQ